MGRRGKFLCLVAVLGAEFSVATAGADDNGSEIEDASNRVSARVHDQDFVDNRRDSDVSLPRYQDAADGSSRHKEAARDDAGSAAAVSRGGEEFPSLKSRTDSSSTAK